MNQIRTFEGHTNPLGFSDISKFIQMFQDVKVDTGSYTDLNDLAMRNQNILYYCNNNTIANLPNKQTGWLLALSPGNKGGDYNGITIQYFLTDNGHTLWKRTAIYGIGWKDWQQIK